MKSKRALLAAALATVWAASPDAGAVHVGADGFGQALIYPYYTVRTAGGNAFNTYLTVMNATSDAKALRVRLREGRAARPVLDFNLYLSPNDMWAGALVPTATGTQVLTTDTSCTDPAFTPGSGTQSTLALHGNSFTGTNADGFGDTLDRTREGYVEIIEMATLSGASAAAITHNSAGVPANCAAIRATTTMIVGAPSGGLSGTLTLINVNSGLDFTLDATALDALSTRAFFRPPGDPYPDWTALEIDPVSVVIARGEAYRSVWTRPLDAVSAVLMRGAWLAEYVLDVATSSSTDVVVALPTRHHHANLSSASAPFTAPIAWSDNCSNGQVGERLVITAFNREESGIAVGEIDFLPPPGAPVPRHCAAVGVSPVVRPGTNPSPSGSLFGSTTQGLSRMTVHSTFQNGWLAIAPRSASQASTPMPTLVSLPASSRQNTATGQASAGSHTFVGLPLVGFFARTFINGTLTCGAGACQGNYGGAFPLRYSDAVTAP